MNARQLKNSILQMAVQGRLVPQDPNDEPASVLLERIRAEKQRLIRLNKAGKTKKDKNESVIYRAQPVGARFIAPSVETQCFASQRTADSAQTGDETRFFERTADGAERDITDELPFDVPETWEWVRLGDVFNIIMGQSPDGNSVGETDKGIEFHQGKVFFSNYVISISNQSTTKPTKIAPANSVLLCVRAPVGKVNLTDRELCIGRGLCAVQPLAGMTVDFVFRLLETYENIFVKQATGTTFIAVTGEVVKNQLVPIPPLAEQHQIVERIEQLLPHIAEYDEAEQKLTVLNAAFPDQIKKSILQAAVQGKLVEQNPNDEPASLLLERIRTEKEQLIKAGKIKKEKPLPPITEDDIPFDIPETWAWCKIAMLGEIVTGSTPLTTVADYYGNEYPFYKPSDLDAGVNVNSSRDMLSSKGYSVSRRLKTNSILVTCIGATIGKTGIIRKEGACNQQINAIIPSGYLSADYIYYCCSADFFQKSIKKNASSTTLPILNKNKFSELLLPLPPFNEQRRIVAKCEELLPLIERCR